MVFVGNSSTVRTIDTQTRSQEAISRLLEAASYTERESQLGSQRGSPRGSSSEMEVEDVDLEQRPSNRNAFKPFNGRVSTTNNYTRDPIIKFISLGVFKIFSLWYRLLCQITKF